MLKCEISSRLNELPALDGISYDLNSTPANHLQNDYSVLQINRQIPEIVTAHTTKHSSSIHVLTIMRQQLSLRHEHVNVGPDTHQQNEVIPLMNYQLCVDYYTCSTCKLQFFAIKTMHCFALKQLTTCTCGLMNT